MLKLPRPVEADRRRDEILRLLSSGRKKLWAGGSLEIPHLALNDAMAAALVNAHRDRHLEPGLENIERVLENETRGLALARRKQGAAPSERISRLLVLASDGSERFFRQCESLLRRHGDRVLGLRLDLPSGSLSERVYGAQKEVKALLVTDRDAVSRVLLGLVG